MPVPSECQQSALGGAVVCLLEGRGEGERDRANEGRGRTGEREERHREREGRQENFSLLRSHGGSVCVCACWSGDHAGKNALANCSELN